jgi:hypothetical protein
MLLLLSCEQPINRLGLPGIALSGRPQDLADLVRLERMANRDTILIGFYAASSLKRFTLRTLLRVVVRS